VSAMQERAELLALPAVAVEVLESLYQHRLLTARQLRALHAPAASLRWTQYVLAQLRRRRLAEHAGGERGLALWFITDRGADTIEAVSSRAETRRRVSSPAQAAGPLRRHTLALNDTGIAFVNAARERGDDCGPLSWRHEVAHPLAPARSRSSRQLLIADALLGYLQLESEQSLALHQRFIELDRGTIPAEQLAAKFTRYARLRNYEPKSTADGSPGGPLWRTYYRAFPSVLVVLADQSEAAAIARMQRVIALARSNPDLERYGSVTVSFVILEKLIARGPFAPIFIAAQPPERWVDWLGQPQPPPR
jgi:hypothetical protein